MVLGPVLQKELIMKIAINGLFYSRRIDGLYRYNNEVLKELDKICKKDEFFVIVPNYVEKLPQFENIQIVKTGNLKGIIWTQISFGLYALNHGMKTLDMCNSTVLWNPGISCVHDLLYLDMEDSFNTKKSKVAIWWSKLNYKIIAKSCNLIFTVSNFSKNRIVTQYHVESKKVVVAPNGWEHMKNVEFDNSIFEKQPKLKKKDYYFTLASMSKYKNFDWIVEEAKVNKDAIFAIAGGSVNSSKYSEELMQLSNVVVLGYVSDGEAAALMKECKAFLFPSKYEGFGIPPMEAMYLGAKAIVSKAASLPEVYEDYVCYIDPEKADYQLDELLKKEVAPANKLFEKYSWKKSAFIICDTIHKHFEKKA